MLETTLASNEFQTEKRPTNTQTWTRLHGRRLATVRVAWAVTTLISVVVYLISLPISFEQLRSLAVDTPTSFFHPRWLSTLDMAALRALGISTDAYAAYVMGLWVICGVVCLSLGLFIFWRRSDNWMALYTALSIIMLGLCIPGTPPSALLKAYPSVHAPYFVLLLVTGVVQFYIGILFPDGRPVPRWMAWLGIVWAINLAIPIFAPDSPANLANAPQPIYLTGILAGFSLNIIAQIYRYFRVATPTQRQQTKWALFGFVQLLILVLVFPLLVTLLVPALTQPGLPHVLYNVVTLTIYVPSLAVWAVAISFSILRHRLWDIDLVINRSLVYGALTALLGLVFVGLALVLQSLFQSLTGGMSSPIAFGASALVIGGLFQPARGRLQNVVDRRFFHLRLNLDQVAAGRPPITRPGLYSGAQFGPYELLEPIGQGGMGEVYKGYQPALNRTVAIKILPPLLADADESFRKRFEREAQTVAGLRHPNIVNVFDFGQLDGAYFMVMEYINGQDLAGYVREHGRLPLAEAQAIIADLGAALDYAHDHNVIHRDVKPSNVMLEQTAQGWRSRVVLMDFGIARVTTNGGTALTQTGAVGTLDYIAPEQILAARTVDRAADIYSLGIVAYKLLTGELPFKADNPASLLFAHLQKPAPDPRDVVDDLPESVARAVLKALAKQPEDRFPSASAFAAALRG